MLSARDLAVGIPAFERPELTARCVESVRATSPELAGIVIADDGSRSSGVEALLGELDRIGGVLVVRAPTNEGPAAAKNRILSALPPAARAVAFLDNDVIAQEGWAEAGLSALDGGADLLQPLLLTPDRSRVERGPNERSASDLSAHPEYLALGARLDDPRVRAPRSNEMVGGTFLCRMEVFRAIGGFDARLRIGEDYDFSLRARAAGFRLAFHPACRLVHDHAFDLSYDLVRASPAECLRAHCVFLERHGRTLYSPRHFDWYRWLAAHGEPMYLSSAERGRRPWRRLARRTAREWYMRTRGKEWGSLEEARRSAAAVEPGLVAPRVRDSDLSAAMPSAGSPEEIVD